MFLDFYGLNEQPFGVTPDPRFLYLGEGHREALAALVYGIESGRGFSALSAEPGMGKTSLLLRLLESLQETARTAFLFQTEGSSREFLRAVLRDLGIVPEGKDLAASHAALNEVLVQELNSGRRVVLVIDEAQNLSEKTLESVRLLSNFETPAAKLMHIVLAGQPRLSKKLARPSLTQLQQRVSGVIQLKPLRYDETIQYIEHRLRTAGLKGPLPFAPEALALISRASRGIPRNINNICFQTLSVGFASQKKLIGVEDVREVLADLEIEHGTPPRRRSAPAAPAAPRVPVQWPHLAPAPDSYGGGEGFEGRSLGTKVAAAFAIAAASIMLLIFLNADRAAGGTDLRSQLADVLFVATGENSDLPPVLPAKLKPPAAPPIEKAPRTPVEPEADAEAEDAAASASGAEGTDTAEERPDATAVRLRNPETAFEIAREYLGRSDWKVVDEIRRLNPQIRGAYEILPAGTRVFLPERAHGGAQNPAASRAERYRREQPSSTSQASLSFSEASTMVHVDRKETIFQFALHQYGRSDWQIISRICALNPQLHDPYQVLQAGQWIRTPELAEER